MLSQVATVATKPMISHCPKNEFYYLTKQSSNWTNSKGEETVPIALRSNLSHSIKIERGLMRCFRHIERSCAHLYAITTHFLVDPMKCSNYFHWWQNFGNKSYSITFKRSRWLNVNLLLDIFSINAFWRCHLLHGTNVSKATVCS